MVETSDTALSVSPSLSVSLSVYLSLTNVIRFGAKKWLILIIMFIRFANTFLLSPVGDTLDSGVERWLAVVINASVIQTDGLVSGLNASEQSGGTGAWVAHLAVDVVRLECTNISCIMIHSLTDWLKGSCFNRASLIFYLQLYRTLFEEYIPLGIICQKISHAIKRSMSKG